MELQIINKILSLRKTRKEKFKTKCYGLDEDLDDFAEQKVNTSKLKDKLKASFIQCSQHGDLYKR